MGLMRRVDGEEEDLAVVFAMTRLLVMSVKI